MLSRGIVVRAMADHRPCRPGVAVRQLHGDRFHRLPLHATGGSGEMRAVVSQPMAQDGDRSFAQQRPQSRIALVRDASQLLLSAGGQLPGNQSQAGRELVPVAIRRPVSEHGGQIGGGEHPDSGYLLQPLARLALQRRVPHVRTLRHLADRLGVQRVVLLAPDVRLHVCGRNQARIVTLILDLPAPPVRSRAGLHRHHAGRCGKQRRQRFGGKLLRSAQAGTAGHLPQRHATAGDLSHQRLHCGTLQRDATPGRCRNRGPRIHREDRNRRVASQCIMSRISITYDCLQKVPQTRTWLQTE